MIFDDRRCELGEGALWHPARKQMFWFDILNQKLLSQDLDGPREWRFPELVSAAGWVTEDVLLIAGERDLFLFDLDSEEIETLCLLEQDNPKNRPNDGRADPFGGFWIGTMGKKAEAGAGAIYRYYRGELRQLFAVLTIPNSISFPAGGAFAHFRSDRHYGQEGRGGRRCDLSLLSWRVAAAFRGADHSELDQLSGRRGIRAFLGYRHRSCDAGGIGCRRLAQRHARDLP